MKDSLPKSDTWQHPTSWTDIPIGACPCEARILHPISTEKVVIREGQLDFDGQTPIFCSGSMEMALTSTRQVQIKGGVKALHEQIHKPPSSFSEAPTLG